MALLSFSNIGIKGLSAAVPERVINNRTFTEFFTEDHVNEIVDKTGVYERRWADETICSSDLCFAAAERLISDLNFPKEEIDALIFVSQTPDYRMPATAIILQDRLGLKKSTLAFDINLGCSGFVYGLSVAYSYLLNDGIRNVLLLDGETRTKQYSFKDRTTGFIFGDAGVAALIGKDNTFGKSYFNLNSDGSRESLIKIPAGGYRKPSSAETTMEKVVDEHGNIRSEEQGSMNGAEVFNFVLMEIPKTIKDTLVQSGETLESIDYFVFHQANSFMNAYLAKKMKLPEEKVPMSIHQFGNTSSVSIPLTMASQLNGKLKSGDKLLLSGFGVGMSWATAVIQMDHCHITDLIEV